MTGPSPQDDAHPRSDPHGGRPLTVELLYAGLRGARRLPGELIRLPLTSALAAVSVVDSLRRRQGGLTGLGLAALDRVVRMRAPGGTEHSTDLAYETEDETAAIEREAEQIRRTARSHLTQVPDRPRARPTPIRPEGETAAAPGAAEPAHPVPPTAAATTSARDERAAPEEPATPPVEHFRPPPPLDADEAPKADELPFTDFDNMSLASLRARLRRLDIAQLTTLRDYERAHANRLQVVMMLENRIARLESTPPADPSASTAG